MKKTLAITTGLSLLLLMFGGAAIVLAHSGNSSSGSSGDEDMNDVDEAAELRIENDGEIRIKNGEVTKVGSDMFDVLAQGMTFMVRVTPDTEFEEDATFSDLMTRDIVEVRGTIEAMNPHMVHADEVKIED